MRPDRVSERLLLRAEYGAHRDAVFVTNVVQVSTGYEERYPRTPARGKWTMTAYGITGLEMHTVRDFFVARKGRQQGFLWNNPMTGNNDKWVRFAKDRLDIRYMAY